ncbi:hypothetical protein ES703_79300 [subsurface metagenome]
MDYCCRREREGCLFSVRMDHRSSAGAIRKERISLDGEKSSNRLDLWEISDRSISKYNPNTYLCN